MTRDRSASSAVRTTASGSSAILPPGRTGARSPDPDHTAVGKPQRPLGIAAYCARAELMHHWLHVPEVEPHEYQLGSPLASIVGIADMLLRRENLDPDVRTHVTAIRDLALDMVREAERVTGAAERP
jgi:hypothetical protein